MSEITKMLSGHSIPKVTKVRQTFNNDLLEDVEGTLLRGLEESCAPIQPGARIAITYVYGIGRTTADKILAATGINPDTRVKDLTREEEAKIRDYIDEANIIVEGDLRRNVALDIKRLVEIQSYRGIRHRKNLPCRGQRTKTNARTCKGPKRTVANKKK